MIAVLAENEEYEVVREFFELFKTPCDFFRSDIAHDVLICAGDEIPPTSARLVLAYGVGGRQDEPGNGASPEHHFSNVVVCGGKRRIPIFGSCSVVRGSGVAILWEEKSREPVASQETSEGRTIV